MKSTDNLNWNCSINLVETLWMEMDFFEERKTEQKLKSFKTSNNIFSSKRVVIALYSKEYIDFNINFYLSVKTSGKFIYTRMCCSCSVNSVYEITFFLLFHSPSSLLIVLCFTACVWCVCQCLTIFCTVLTRTKCHFSQIVRIFMNLE